MARDYQIKWLKIILDHTIFRYFKTSLRKNYVAKVEDNLAGKLLKDQVQS